MDFVANCVPFSLLTQVGKNCSTIIIFVNWSLFKEALWKVVLNCWIAGGVESIIRKKCHYGFPKGQNLISYCLKFKIWVQYIKIYSIWSKNTEAFTLVSKTNKDMTLLSMEGKFSAKKQKKWRYQKTKVTHFIFFWLINTLKIIHENYPRKFIKKSVFFINFLVFFDIEINFFDFEINLFGNWN